MTNEQLAVLIQQGQREYIPALYNQVKKLLSSMAYSYFTRFYDACASCGVTRDDLTQEGFFAMLDAIHGYKPDAGLTFTAYLKFPFLNRFHSLTGHRHGARDPLNVAESLDAPLSSENENFTRGDTVADDNAAEQIEAVNYSMYRSSLHAALKSSMEELDLQQQEVIRYRYFEGLTLQAIGDRIGCSRE